MLSIEPLVSCRPQTLLRVSFRKIDCEDCDAPGSEERRGLAHEGLIVGDVFQHGDGKDNTKSLKA
jgi:hypothetical protein